MITRVNKQPTGTKDQFDAVVGKLKTGDDVVFEVIDPAASRGGNQLHGRHFAIVLNMTPVADSAPASFQKGIESPYTEFYFLLRTAILSD